MAGEGRGGAPGCHRGWGGAPRAVGLVTGWWDAPWLSAVQACPLEGPCRRQDANHSTQLSLRGSLSRCEGRPRGEGTWSPFKGTETPGRAEEPTDFLVAEATGCHGRGLLAFRRGRSLLLGPAHQHWGLRLPDRLPGTAGPLGTGPQ